jgi:hypothetical protein
VAILGLSCACAKPLGAKDASPRIARLITTFVFKNKVVITVLLLFNLLDIVQNPGLLEDALLRAIESKDL